MAREVLDAADVGAGFQDPCGEEVSEHVGRDAFLQPGPLRR
jgi:hypothetical protein